MPKSAPFVMRVSARDREIFQKVSVEGLAQRKVAGEYQLSQPRVAAIMKRMKRWSEQPLPPGLEESCRGDRLAGLARVHRMRLALYRDLAMEAYRKSENVVVVKQFFDAEGKKLREERTGKSAGGNVRFIDFAEKFGTRLLEFDGVAKDGSVDLAAKNRLPDHQELTHDEFMEGLEELMERRLPEVRAWRAKKDAAEEKVRNGECGVRSEEACAPVAVASSAEAGEPPPQGRGRGDEGRGRLEERRLDAKPLSESLSRFEAGNSAVESILATVIAQLIGVINVIKAGVSALKTQAGESVGWTSGPTGKETVGPKVQPTTSYTPHSELRIPHSNLPVGPEVQPTKAEPERDMFYHMRHLLPRVTSVTQRQGRITYENRIKRALPEEELYFE